MIAVIMMLSSLAADGSDTAQRDAALVKLQAERSERIDTIFNSLTLETMHLLDDFYADDVTFVDPLGELEGLDALRRYYTKMYSNVDEISFDFTNEIVQGDTHVVMWTLNMRTEGMADDERRTVDGNSVITFGEGDKVVYHRDYFDMGALVYRHVTFVGWLVNMIDDRLKVDSHE